MPCYLLDGNNAKASKWYADLYQQWQVDGIKEDTMMHLGQLRIWMFSTIPIANIANITKNDALGHGTLRQLHLSWHPAAY